MKKWLSDYRVESTLCLVDGQEGLLYRHPAGEYEIRISDTPDPVPQGEQLSMQIILQAADIVAADSATHLAMEKFLHLMSFVTSCPFKITKRISLIDWTPGIAMREAYAYGPRDEGELIPGISEPLFDTAAMLQRWGTSPLLDTSLRWFAGGVRSKVMDDQFQFFWFVIELIATATKTATRVADKCPRCSGDLYCPTCNETPTHRPYEKQKISNLFSTLQVSEQKSADLFYIRNALMHGTPREQIETQILERDATFSFDKAVDLAGRIAWQLILKEFKPTEAAQPQFLNVSTFVNWVMTPKAHIRIGVPDAENPKIENVHLPVISFVRPPKKPRTNADIPPATTGGS